MTDQEEPSSEAYPEKEIEVAGRKFWVRMPKPEQLMVWQRTIKQLGEADTSNWNGAQVMAALERSRKIIDSLLVNKVDREWLDDAMLDGEVTIQEAASIITLSVKAFAEEANNRQERRTAAKAVKKAARKKA